MKNESMAREGQYLTFTLNQQIFGISIDVVREINQLPEITPVPNAPLCVSGVINLRDRVVPVVDLRCKFKLPFKEHSRDTCVIVVDGHQGQVAIVVDTVASVLPLRRQQIEAPPSLVQNSTSAAWIIGLAKTEQQVLVLLDIGLVVDQESIHEIADLSVLKTSAAI